MRIFGWDLTIRKLNGKPFYTRNMVPNYMIGHDGPVWIPVDEPWKIYTEIPQVQIVVNRLAKMQSNVVFKTVDIKTSEEKPIDELYRLFENPNPMQSMNEWVEEMVIQRMVYGNSFLFKNQPTRAQNFPSTISNISPRYLTPELTGKYFKQNKMKDIVKRYEFCDNGKTLEYYDTETILWQKNTDIDNPLIGISPLVGLQYPISNILSAYKYRNVIMNKRGAIGMLSSEAKDGMGAVPLTPEEIDRIKKDYIDKHGIESGQFAMLMTEAAVKYTPFGYPTKQMMLFEEVSDNFNVICDRFGTHRDIFSGSNTKYDDAKLAIISTYEDTIQPAIDNFCQKLTKFLLPENFQSIVKIIGTFDHLAILKRDKRTGIEGVKSLIAALSQATAGGEGVVPFMDKSEAKLILDNELRALGLTV